MTKRRFVRLADGTTYFSDDNWETVWRVRRGTSHRIVSKEEADRVRFLVASGAAED